LISAKLLLPARALSGAVLLEHVPQNWTPVLRKGHAETSSQSGMTIRRKVIML
jgi:hypothetical protein